MTTLTKPPLGYLKVADAARKLGISRQRVHQLILSGDLRGKVHYRRTYVHQNSVTSRRDLLENVPDDHELAPDGWLTVRQVADRFDVSRSTARNWMRTGVLSGCVQDPRNMWISPVDSVEAFSRPTLGRPVGH